ncbi:MAG: glycoside hydrolase family 140 protein [Chitinophagaceae bacterium]
MKKTVLLLVLFYLTIASTYGQSLWTHGQLKVSPDGHYLQFSDGTGFFWLGDTGWELFHRLKKEEVENYLENRRRKGFNVIQAVALAEFDGIHKANQYGEAPLKNADPLQPNEKYFVWMDTVINIAKRKGLFIGLLPTWGDKVTEKWGAGPAVFNKDNAYAYGAWIGKRYAAYPNIIWILGGDRPAVKDSNDWRPIWRAMAKGILDATDNKALITYHPQGGKKSTSQIIHNEDWLNINMFQSGHGDGHDVTAWEWVARDRALSPTKPTLDAEPNYEDHPVNPWPTWNPANGYFNDYDVRKQTYRTVFAGACGVTYGHHSVWQFWSPREEVINHAKMYWTEAIDRPGAFQVGYLRRLIESRGILNRIPDDAVIVEGQGEKGAHMVAFRDGDNNYGMVYLPIGKTITVNGSFIAADKIMAWWFNTRTGKATKIGLQNKSDKMQFTPPATGEGNDWVLVLDNPSKHFSEPGSTK